MELLLSKSNYCSAEADLGSNQGGGVWTNFMDDFICINGGVYVYKTYKTSPDLSTMVCSLITITVVDNSYSPLR